jgi:hypothetical protein
MTKLGTVKGKKIYTRRSQKKLSLKKLILKQTKIQFTYIPMKNLYSIQISWVDWLMEQEHLIKVLIHD